MTSSLRRTPAFLLGLALFAPALASAQSYECAAPVGTSCDVELSDAYRDQSDTPATPGVVESALTVLPGDCDDEALLVDVDLELDIAHSYVGDLAVDLVHPDGTQVRVLYRPGLGTIDPSCPGDDLRLILDDEGAIAFDACSTTIPAVSGRVRPWNPLSLLDGRTRNGTWRLRISDLEPGERGVLRGWTLHLPCTLQLPTVEIEALDGLVSERGDDDTATLRVTRSGDTTDELEVAYVVTGTASSEDIEPLPGTLTLPAGSASATFDVHAVADDLDEIDETVIVTLVASPRYTIGPRDSAQVLVREGSAVEPDAGTPDAGGEETDAGVDPGDAGGRQVIDAGTSDEVPDEGCSCEATGARGGSGAPFSLAALGLLALAFGRRRTGRRRT